MKEMSRGGLWFSVLIAAFGYFVDLYDIAIFAIVRVSSLESLGLTGDANTQWGILLLNLQMIGLLIGGLIWGVIGDKYGRRTALLATILCFSLANIANAFVTSVEQYAVIRFIAGVGLAGELGASVALVSELLPKNKRGWGVIIISLLGIAGSFAAAWVGNNLDWRVAYLVGGIGGLLVLAGRFGGMKESAMFEASKASGADRGSLKILFTQKTLLLRLLAVVAVGMPIWYVSGLLVSFAPEFGKALGMTAAISVGTVAIYQALGLGVGNLLAGALSEKLHSRKKVLWGCLFAIPLATVVLLLQDTPKGYATVMFFVGIAMGYWSVYLTMGAEQFGTNIRALVSISVPNFVRGTVVLITFSAGALSPVIGWIPAAIVIGVVVFGLAAAGLASLRETYDIDLDYVER